MATYAGNARPVELRLAVKTRTTLIPLALFALAFFGALFALKGSGPAAPGPAKALPVVHDPALASAAVPAPLDRVALVAAARFEAPAAVPESVAETPRPPEAVEDAIDTLEYSGSPEGRVRAVSRARSSLRVAAADDDPDVAARAQEEYEALVEREDR